MGVNISRDAAGRITVAFRYNPQFVAKVKTILGYRYHPEEKHWNVSDSDCTPEKILKEFTSRKYSYSEISALRLYLQIPIWGYIYAVNCGYKQVKRYFDWQIRKERI